MTRSSMIGNRWPELGCVIAGLVCGADLQYRAIGPAWMPYAVVAILAVITPVAIHAASRRETRGR